MASPQPAKSDHDPLSSSVFIVAEQERSRKWWQDGEVEFISKNEVLSGFALFASFESVMQDKPVWTIMQETGNSSDKILVSQFRFLPSSNARTESPMTTFFKNPPPNFSVLKTALGRCLVSPLPPTPKVTSKRNTRNLAAKQSDYRIPIPDGDFDQHESLITVQASLISYYRHLSPAGGFISLDAVALQLTKDTFCSAFHLAPSEKSSLEEVVLPFQTKVQNACIALALLKMKRSEGKFESSTLTAIKQFQADFNKKSPIIRAICLSYPLHSTSYHHSSASSTNTASQAQGNDGTPDASDPSLQIRTDGALEHRTVSALFAYVCELKTYLDSFGFPTPSDPLKTPKRFKSIFTAIRNAIDIPNVADGSSELPSLTHLSMVPAFIEECGLANKQSLESGKPVPEHLRDTVLKLLQIANTFKPKEKKKHKRLSTGSTPVSVTSTPAMPSAISPPIAMTPTAVQPALSSSQTIVSTSPSSSKPIDIKLPKVSPYEARDDSVFPSSPKGGGTVPGSPKSFDSPRRAMTSPLLRSIPPGKKSSTDGISVIDLVANTYVVFDREYHESVPTWMSEIEIVDFSVVLVGYKLYIDPASALSRVRPSSVLVQGDADDIVTGMIIRLKSKPNDSLSLWDYYTRSNENEAESGFETIRSVHGMLIVENLNDTQIAARKLIRCPDGLFNPHVSMIRIQATLAKLNCQAKDFEFSLSNPNLRSQDQLYLKYKIERRLPIDDALYQIVRNVQICLVALNCLPLKEFSPWYSNYVSDAVLKFEREYELSRETDDGKRLAWVAGNMTFLIYEELLNQTNLFHKALLDLGFPVKCTPFEDPAQFYTYTLAYYETQKQLSDVINSSPRHLTPKVTPTKPVQTGSSPSATSNQPSNPGDSVSHPIPVVPVYGDSAMRSSSVPAGQSINMAKDMLQIPAPGEMFPSVATPLSPLMARHAPPELGQMQISISTPAFSTAPTSSTPNPSSIPVTISASHGDGLVGGYPSPTSPGNAPLVPAFRSAGSGQPPLSHFDSTDHAVAHLSQEIEFGSSLASKYKEALREHEELHNRYSVLEESFLELSNDAAEANTSLQFFEEQYKESVQNYDLLTREYEALKRTASENEEITQTLVRNVALLETKLQQLQRIAQRGFTTQLLWYLILTVLYILLLPALGIAFLIDLYRSKRGGIELSDSTSLRAQLSRYSKHQLTKLEHVIDELEAKVIKWTGVETSTQPVKEKRN